MCHQHIEGKMASHYTVQTVGVQKSGAWSLPKPHFPQLLQEHSLHLPLTAPDSMAREPPSVIPVASGGCDFTCPKRGCGVPQLCVTTWSWSPSYAPHPRGPSALGAPCGV